MPEWLFTPGGLFLMSVVFVLIIYIAARLATAAYFNSLEDHQRKKGS